MDEESLIKLPWERRDVTNPSASPDLIGASMIWLVGLIAATMGMLVLITTVSIAKIAIMPNKDLFFMLTN